MSNQFKKKNSYCKFENNFSEILSVLLVTLAFIKGQKD